MKILILYTYNKSLLSEFFQELSEKLCADGFEVVNFYLKHEKSQFKINNVSFYGEKRGNLVANYREIYKIIKQIKPDVVISNFSYINPAILFGKLLGVKINIAWFHTAFGHTKPNLLKIWNKSLYLNLADVVLTNSKSLQSEMHTVYKVPKDKTRRIPFWTSIENYSSNPNNLKISKQESVVNIGCPGRLFANKNHAMVIEALSQLKNNRKQTVRLFIAGNGPYKKHLQQMVTDLDMEDDVIFLGLLNVNEMTSFYKAMDVIVLPSFYEAFGLVFIEAIALGTSVLVSNTFGALDFINRKKFSIDQFSFNPHDISDLIDKLDPYLNYTGLESNYFKRMYEESFEKELIYNQIKTVILN
ncbi:glycosyltransferase involved in cell wall biosynthesis [Winogradskyella epiphytica]|uniref:Glycosyltransferase involved in cell wall biosynthesis n=1 Tax=Winogradskyella epiphytica TaxID=262005 RepID=A0A2V4WY01_9FLAO|nr:glycosyltransferase family 4 protein [Winogradskyella epiphytica]PYE82126.1 glycosyltransferase involved in cell wall biosynthesis [Winogradskyella epiphytica]GGW60353.1 hypothetical protein GCM10008085_09700 [Winogradskyella epiphytica]